MPVCRQLITVLPLQRNRFNSRPFHKSLVVARVAMRLTFSEYFGCPLSVTLYYCTPLPHLLPRPYNLGKWQITIPLYQTRFNNKINQTLLFFKHPKLAINLSPAYRSRSTTVQKQKVIHGGGIIQIYSKWPWNLQSQPTDLREVTADKAALLALWRFYRKNTLYNLGNLRRIHV